MTDNLILWELQKIHEALTKTNEQQTLNFRKLKSTEKFIFSEPILNTTKLGLIRLSVYNSVFNVNRSNYQFLYASTVIDSGAWVEPHDDALAEPLSSNSNTNTNTNSINSSNITSVLSYNYKGIHYIQLLHRVHMS